MDTRPSPPVWTPSETPVLAECGSAASTAVNVSDANDKAQDLETSTSRSKI